MEGTRRDISDGAWQRRLVLPSCLISGVIVGVLVSFDPSWSHATRGWLGIPSSWRGIPIGGPFLYSGLAAGLGLLGMAVLVLRWRPRLQEGTLAVGILLVCYHLSGFGAGTLNPLSLAVFLLIARSPLYHFTHPDRPWIPSFFSALVWLFVACILLSLVGRGSGFLSSIAKVTPKLMVPLLIIGALGRFEQVHSAFRIMIWSFVAMAVFGLVQTGVSFFTGVDIANLLLKPEGSGLYTPFGRAMRPSGFSTSVNGYVVPLATISIVVLVLVIFAETSLKRAVLAMSVLLMWLAVGLTTVRGSWVAVVVGSLAVPFIVAIRRAPLWIGSYVLLGGAGLLSGLVPWLLRWANELRTESLSFRLNLMEIGIGVAANHPWRGVGLFRFGQFSPELERHQPHNTPIVAASQLGVPGLVVYLAILIWVTLRLVHGLRVAKTPLHRAVCSSLLAGMIALLVAMQLEDLLYNTFPWLYFGFCEAAVRGVVMAAGSSEDASQPTRA